MIHTGAEHDFVRCGCVLIAINSIAHAFRFVAFEHQRDHLGITDDLEISSRARRTEIGHRGRLPFAVFDIARRRRDTIGIRLVLIVEARQFQQGYGF